MTAIEPHISGECLTPAETRIPWIYPTTQPPVSVLHKIARWNHLRLSWSLVEESGPPHCPKFGIQLSLLEPNSTETELFCGYGTSIQKAKHQAATHAMEGSSVLQAILKRQEVRQHKPPTSKEHQLLRNLTLDIPHPSGPRAEALQLAHVLKVEANFFRLPDPPCTNVGRSRSSVSSVSNEFSTGDLCSPSCGGIHRVALSFGGRQFVGEASTLSGAEQEASVAFLRALQLVLVSFETFAKRKHFLPQPDQRIHFRPNCSVWRLQVLAGLHRLHPTFKVFQSDLAAIDGSNQNTKKSYRCVCSLPSFKSVDACGPSKAIARKRAAEAMLSCLISEHSDDVILPIECPQQPSPGPDIRRARNKSTKTKTGQRFKLGRTCPEYGEYVHPMARLHYIASAKKIPGPKCWVTVDQSTPPDESPLPGRGISSSTSQFRCEMQFDVHRTIGAPAANKRLARRFAAEAMLKLIGFTRPKSPIQKGVLRSRPTERNIAPEPEGHPDHSCAPQSTCNSDTHHTRHTSFSSTMDVLVLNDAAANASRRPFKSRTTRLTCLRRANSSSPHADRRTPRRSSSGSFILPPPVPSDHAFSTTPIGHWSDSEEAMGFCDSSSLRRSRSSNLVTGVSLAQYHSISWLQNESAFSLTRALMTTKMRLLSQLAVFFLKENAAKHTVCDDTQISAYPNATKHLLSLCQRLRIPCKFIDQPPRQQWSGENDRKSGATDTQHNTILVIGEPALNTSGSNTPSSLPNTIVVQALGFNMLSARQRASVAAFRQLAELKSHFN